MQTGRVIVIHIGRRI